MGTMKENKKNNFIPEASPIARKAGGGLEIIDCPAATRREKDFEQGVADCIAGIRHQDKSESYTRGYAEQYQLEQHESRPCL